MIQITMFCNTTHETDLLRQGARSEVLLIQSDRVRIRTRNKNGEPVNIWMPKQSLTNFRYWAHYNGNKAEYTLARKLVEIGTILFNEASQDLHFEGSYELKDLKRLVNEHGPYAEYYKSKNGAGLG